MEITTPEFHLYLLLLLARQENNDKYNIAAESVMTQEAFKKFSSIIEKPYAGGTLTLDINSPKEAYLFLDSTADDDEFELYLNKVLDFDAKSGYWSKGAFRIKKGNSDKMSYYHLGLYIDSKISCKEALSILRK